MNPVSRFRHASAASAAVLSTLLLLASAAAGDEPLSLATSAGAHDMGELGLEAADGAIRLPLDAAIEAALRRNLSLTVDRYRHSQSLYTVLQRSGIFDLQLGADFAVSSNTRPPGSALEEADVVTRDQTLLNLDVQQLLPWGGTAAVFFNNSETESSDLFFQPNPQYSVDLDFQFSQPLLRNFGRLNTERDILVARTNVEVSREQFRTQVETVILDVSNRYWELVEARAQLEVSQESLALAKELHEMNKIQVDVGTMAPLELVQSEAGVATREEEIIRRSALVEDRADDLRRLLNLDRGDLWTKEIVPITEAEMEPRSVDLEAAIETAIENRPEVRRQQLDNEIRELDAKVAANLKKPSLDVVARYGYNAVDGELLIFEDPFDPDPDTATRIPNGYSDALDQIVDGDFDGWSVQLMFGYPLQNREARARAAIADLAVEEGERRLEDLELQILTEVRAAARAVETAAKQIDSAKASIRLARKNLEAEQKRYENGLSTSFRVLEIQEDLSEAQSRGVVAVITYRKALVALDRVSGRLLDENDIALEDEEMPTR